MKLKTNILGWSVLISLLVSTSVWAFPAWVGVYGSHVRYEESSNPGTFTVLMSEDYVGLHTEVGVQVNGGTWDVFQMTYVGQENGDSIWQYAPLNAFPAGATIVYYFHGYDDAGNHIFDNNSGNNYSTALQNLVTGSFEFSEYFGVTTSSGIAAPQLAVVTDNQYMLWKQNGMAMGSTKPEALPWNPGLSLGAFENFAVVSDGTRLHRVLGTSYQFSDDAGLSWSSQSLAPPLSNLIVDGPTVYGIHADTVIESGVGQYDFYLYKLQEGSTTWEGPFPILQAGGWLQSYSVTHFAGAGGVLGVAIHEGRWNIDYYYESGDDGESWGEATPPQHTLDYFFPKFDMDETGRTYMTIQTAVASDTLIKSLTRNPGGSWVDEGNVWTGPGLRNTALVLLPQGLVAIAEKNGGPEYRLLPNGSSTWAAPEPADSVGYRYAKDGLDLHGIEFTGDGSGSYSLGSFSMVYQDRLEDSDLEWANAAALPIEANDALQVEISVDGSRVFAAWINSSGEAQTAYKPVDGNWNEVTTLETSADEVHITAEDGKVHAVVRISIFNGLSTYYRSEDAGATWNSINASAPPAERIDVDGGYLHALFHTKSSFKGETTYHFQTTRVPVGGVSWEVNQTVAYLQANMQNLYAYKTIDFEARSGQRGGVILRTQNGQPDFWMLYTSFNGTPGWANQTTSFAAGRPRFEFKSSTLQALLQSDSALFTFVI